MTSLDGCRNLAGLTLTEAVTSFSTAPLGWGLSYDFLSPAFPRMPFVPIVMYPLAIHILLFEGHGFSHQ